MFMSWGEVQPGAYSPDPQPPPLISRGCRPWLFPAAPAGLKIVLSPAGAAAPGQRQRSSTLGGPGRPSAVSLPRRRRAVAAAEVVDGHLAALLREHPQAVGRPQVQPARRRRE